MFSYLVVLKCLLDDLCIYDSRDYQYLRSRFKNEGAGVFTALLPSIGDAILNSLETGRLPVIEGLRYVHHQGRERRLGIPILFYGSLKRIYNSKGLIKRDFCVVTLKSVLQVCYYFKKLVFEPTDDLIMESIDSYLSTERYLASYNSTRNESHIYKSALRKIHALLHRRAPGEYMDLATLFGKIIPRRTSGSYSSVGQSFRPSHIPLNDRYLPDHIESIKLDDAVRGLYCKKQSLDRSSRAVRLNYGSDDGMLPRVAEVLFVPKTSRKLRTISKEPINTLEWQMGLHYKMADDFHRLSFGRVNFGDQSVNRELARLGSLDGKWSTIDLSSASDSLSYKVIEDVYSVLPGLLSFITRFRSNQAYIKQIDSFISLKKLSGMGSGFTFPLMAFTLHLAIAAYLSIRYGGSVEKYQKSVYVFGDDIVVPTTYVKDCLAAIHAFGFKVNTSKTFYRGQSFAYFRESCGGNFVNGNDVTPIRCSLPSNSCSIGVFSKKMKRFQRHHYVAKIYAHINELETEMLDLTARYYTRVLLSNLDNILPLDRSIVDLLLRDPLYKCNDHPGLGFILKNKTDQVTSTLYGNMYYNRKVVVIEPVKLDCDNKLLAAYTERLRQSRRLCSASFLDEPPQFVYENSPLGNTVRISYPYRLRLKINKVSDILNVST